MINTPTSTKPKAPTNGCIKRTVNSQSQSAPIKSHHGMRIAHSCRSLISSTYQYIYHTHVSNLPKPFSFFHFPSESSTLILENISLSMASDNVSNMAGDDDKYGFRRPEMYQSNITGTVDAYDRHVFLCYKRPEAWASRVEDSEFDPLPKLFASALKARKNDITVKTKLTVCDGGDGTDSSDGDVLVFPEMIKYRCLKDSDVDSFVEDVLVNGKQWVAGEQEKLTGSFVFVCAHGSRDRRCGVCGPVLIQKLKEEIEVRGLNDQVFVKPCSHIGGHKYAGNLIIYGPSQDGKITGHWYGYVTPDDVPEMLDQHIGKGEVIERLWRGQMGVSAEENEKAKDQKLPNAEDVKKSKEKHQENGSENTKENLSGCCQGANGFTCCKDGNVEQSSKDEDRTYTKEGPLCKDEGKNYTKEGPHCNLSNWIRTWEQNDFLAGVGLVGAVAAVAVAYSYYKRSG